MKKILFILFTISLCSHFTMSQWVQQTSGVSSGLTETRFINQSTGWVCGTGGTILKTTNSGVNWFSQSSNVTKSLIDIFPVDSQVVYCVGQFETILKTTNGGDNWITIRNGPISMGKSFHGVTFINENTGWICGSGQWTLRTTNGCTTFDSSLVGTSFSWDVYFKDSMNGLIAGEVGTMFKTTNGGINWNLINMLGEAAEFFELTFINDTGWTIGLQTRKIYKTTNFGASWDSVGNITGITSWFTGLFFSSLNTGWACGDAGSLYRTSNGGINWYKQTVPAVGYSTCYFTSDSIGWAVGSVGTIIHTTSSGQIVGINNSEAENSDKYLLSQNFPNPFNPLTKIRYQILNNNSLVKLAVTDILGKEMQVLVDEKQNAGSYEVNFDAGDLPSGIYFYRLTTPGFTETKKMILIK